MGVIEKEQFAPHRKTVCREISDAPQNICAKLRQIQPFRYKNMMTNIQTRWQAFAVHMTISLVIFFVVSATILLHWYPDYFRHFGGLMGVGLIAGIDLVLGPLLTLLVFNRAKKHLKWDLTAVGLLQFIALSYGIWSVYQGRPIAQVLTHEGIYIVTQADLRFYKMNAENFKGVAGQLPLKVHLSLPEDLEAIKQIEFLTGFMSDKPLSLRTDLYSLFSAESPSKVEYLIGNRPFDEFNSCYLLPIISAYQESTACLDPKTGNLKRFGAEQKIIDVTN